MNRRRLPDCQRGAVSLSRTPDRLPPPRSTDLYAGHFFLHIVGIIRGDTRSGIHQGMEGCHMPRMKLQVSSQPEPIAVGIIRSEEQTSELQSLMRISYAVFRLNKQKNLNIELHTN